MSITRQDLQKINSDIFICFYEEDIEYCSTIFKEVSAYHKYVLHHPFRRKLKDVQKQYTNFLYRFIEIDKLNQLKAFDKLQFVLRNYFEDIDRQLHILIDFTYFPMELLGSLMAWLYQDKIYGKHKIEFVSLYGNWDSNIIHGKFENILGFAGYSSPAKKDNLIQYYDYEIDNLKDIRYNVEMFEPFGITIVHHYDNEIVRNIIEKELEHIIISKQYIYNDTKNIEMKDRNNIFILPHDKLTSLILLNSILKNERIQVVVKKDININFKLIESEMFYYLDFNELIEDNMFLEK